MKHCRKREHSPHQEGARLQRWSLRRMAGLVVLVVLAVGLVGCPKNEPTQVRRDSMWSLLRKLRSSEAAERRQAARAIGRMGPRGHKALSALRRALRDPDADVRRAVVQAMQQIGPKAMPSLIEAAGAKDPVVRSEARRILSFAGKEKLETLRQALRDPFWRVRMGAATLLGDMKKDAEDAVPDLAKALGDQEADVRKAAAIALRTIGPPEAAEPAVVRALGKALKSNQSWWQLRIEIAKTLGSFGEKGAPAALDLIELLHDKDKKVQQAGAAALRQIGTSAIPAMKTALGSAPWQAKIWVTRILGEMGKKAIPAVPALVDALGDNDIDVRKGALLTLNRLGPAAISAMPKLLRIIKDPSLPRHIWEGALRCIFSIGNQGTLGLLSLLESDDWTIRRKIMENIGRLGAKVGPEAVPFLIQALSHKQKEVRWTSAMVLSKLGPKAAPAVSALTQSLNDTDPITRKWSARALGAIGAPARSSIPALNRRKRDPNASVRDAVTQALSQLQRKPSSR